MLLWQSYLPYHVAKDLLAHPGQSPVGREQRFEAVVLFADVSGFTALSEALGATGKDGTEELTALLNRYFEPMIALIQSYGGIIGKFGGDAMTVLFPYHAAESQATARRAVQCALEMQARMGDYAAIPTRSGAFGLTMKAGLAAGPLFCTTAGDPSLRLEYIIAGRVLDDCAEAEHHARSGEVVLHQSLLQAAAPLEVRTQREGFAIVAGLTGEALPQPLSPLAQLSPQTASLAAAYIHPSIAARLQEGQVSFINEHRKVTILFVNFAGYNYEQDPQAGSRLQAYLLQIIQVVARYDGYLNKVDMGDKGSKCVIIFGAPIAHEDDAERALRCALDIRSLPGQTTRIGVNTGFVYCGQVGSDARREYTVMGDAVNLSARLMQAAAPGQVLVSQAAQHAAARSFRWGEQQSIAVKGKAQAVSIYPLLDVQVGKSPTFQEPRYTLPMVGRQAELQSIDRRLFLARQGQGQIIGITAEAGMGKSRLAAEVVKSAARQGFRTFGGECLSHGTSTPYLVWRNLLGSIFELKPADPPEAQQRSLEAWLTAFNPVLMPRLPLLGTALNLPIPENDLTRSLEPRLRKSSLEDLVSICIRHAAQTSPLLLALEDCHWLDPLSDDLLEIVGRSIASAPVLLLVVYRPPQAHRQGPAVTRLPHFAEIHLAEFTPEETSRLIDLKLSQLFGAAQNVPAEFVERITQRAQGNPFYIDEMVNLIHDRGIDPRDPKALQNFTLPDSLHSLIISRIDQLSEAPKTTLKVASVIGRSFRASWLWGAYPALGAPEQVLDHLVQLSALDITPPDKFEPELEYLFKHIVTREVAYESLALATRTMLHGEISAFIERTYQGELGRCLNLLAHHYGLSQNTAKQVEYFRKAGQAAQAAYANQAAIEYYQRLLPLLQGAERIETMLALGEVWQLTGRWSEAQEIFREALAAAQECAEARLAAQCQYALGRLARQEGDFPGASQWLAQARQGFSAVANIHGVGEATRESGTVLWSQGNLEAARDCFHQCLALSTQANDPRGTYRALGNIGLLCKVQGEYNQALEYYQRAHQIAEGIGDLLGVSIIVGNMGNVYLDQGDYVLALEAYLRKLSLALELGYQFGINVAVGNLGMIYFQQGEYANARLCYAYNLHLVLELGDRPGVAEALWNLGETDKALGQYAAAQQWLEQAVELGSALDTPYERSDYLNSLADLLERMSRWSEAQQATSQALALAQECKNQDVQFKARLRQISLQVQASPNQLPQAICDLQALLEDDELEPSEQAAAHYQIWRIDPRQESHRQQATAAYAALYQATPNIEFKRRCEELTGTILPDPPALPPLPEVVTRAPIDLDEALAQVRLLTQIE